MTTTHPPNLDVVERNAARTIARSRMSRMAELVSDDEELRCRLQRVMAAGRGVRASEYHLTNACNIRCKGCWFFEFGHDVQTRDEKDMAALEQFLQRETVQRRVNSALIIGGEPTLFPERIRLFTRYMKNVTISSNGLRPLPKRGFERVAIALTVFGGGPLDDELRGVKPNGRRFNGLLDKMLANYRNDRRAKFIYAITEDGIGHVEETTRRIKENGNHLTFNYYTKYDERSDGVDPRRDELLAEALRVKALYPDTVISHPYYIRTIITGETSWGRFGYETCPSISIDYPAHAERMKNGHPTLPFFNTWAADLKTVKFCCTSGHCTGCRDSQAVFSWLVVNPGQFLASKEQLRTWIEVAESYWRQFCWSQYHVGGEIEAPADAPMQPQEELAVV